MATTPQLDHFGVTAAAVEGDATAHCADARHGPGQGVPGNDRTEQNRRIETVCAVR